MQRMEARRSRSGQIVGVADAMTVADSIGEIVELVAPSGSDTAHARVLSMGRPFQQGGIEVAYAYVAFLDAA